MKKKPSFLALLRKKFPEKLSGLSVKGGGYSPFPLRKKPSFFTLISFFGVTETKSILFSKLALSFLSFHINRVVYVEELGLDCFGCKDM